VGFSEQETLKNAGPVVGFGRGASAARSDPGTMKVKIQTLGRLFSLLEAEDFERRVFQINMKIKQNTNC
jgi:hypothetical protein